MKGDCSRNNIVEPRKRRRKNYYQRTGIGGIKSYSRQGTIYTNESFTIGTEVGEERNGEVDPGEGWRGCLYDG